MKIVKKGKIEIKSWCNEPESGAINQALNLANHPRAFRHISLMPDTHQGFGMPIGGVLATKDCVISNGVGVDIGCGMIAVKTSLNQISTDQLKNLMRLIRKKVPVGNKSHKHLNPDAMPPVNFNFQSIVESNYLNAAKQIGTLGGGNHFIEIQKGDDGHIWFMIHSGSRNLGYQVAKHYNKIAEEINEEQGFPVPKSHELAFLDLKTIEAKHYLLEMNYCLEFALRNRQEMANKVKESIQLMDVVCQCKGKKKKCIICNGTGFDKNKEINKDVKFVNEINIHHNYAAIETHFGESVVVHRKGATSARLNELGIIPGSQGTKSYIVRGKGNKDSFESCSHGAGRKMSRSSARSNLDFEDEQRLLNDKGIIHSIRSARDLDEAPGSYKSIDTVMKEQSDLVEIVVELSPLGVIKG